MTPAEICELLKRHFSEAVLQVEPSGKMPFATVKPEALHDIMQLLRDEPELHFDFLQLVSAIDYPDRFTCVYHLSSYTHGHAIAIKTDLPKGNPTIRSVADLWPTADWHEREEYDMMGIIFEGHPNLRRIMLPEDWEGHPLRKDYVQPTEYHDISNVRKVGDRSYPAPDQDQKAIPPYKEPKPPEPKPQVAQAEETKPPAPSAG